MKRFTKDQMSDISSNGTIDNFSVDDSAIDKEDILNIHDYFMIRNNMK